MIAGYVNYQELKLLTGFNYTMLKRIIKEGRLDKKITVFGKVRYVEEALYNLKEVEEYIKVMIY